MRRTIGVYLGDAAHRVGTLHFSAEGNREAAAFTYASQWLADPERFAIDPALPLVSGPQYHQRNHAQHDSVFFGAIADTEADGWGRQIIVRNHAKRPKARGEDAREPLNSLDFLLAVDDFSRVGALRFRDESKAFAKAVGPGERGAPPLVELRQMLQASSAVEQNKESTADLDFLLGRGTSLGGLRPKSSVIDEQGQLCIGKFPSVGDTRPVTRGEALALQLAHTAGLNAAEARVVACDGAPVTLVRRFDRVGAKRRMYVSARTLLQANDDEEHTYTEIVDALRQHGHSVSADLEELWRRMAYNILITNVDDHLNNHGFLHVAHGQWSLAPAFDLNPFPDKARVLKTWISEDTGPTADIEAALSAAKYFGLSDPRAKTVLAQMVEAIGHWRQLAAHPSVGMSPAQIEQFADAFEHPQLTAAKRAVASVSHMSAQGGDKQNTKTAPTKPPSP